MLLNYCCLLHGTVIETFIWVLKWTWKSSLTYLKPKRSRSSPVFLFRWLEKQILVDIVGEDEIRLNPCAIWIIVFVLYSRSNWLDMQASILFFSLQPYCLSWPVLHPGESDHVCFLILGFQRAFLIHKPILIIYICMIYTYIKSIQTCYASGHCTLNWLIQHWILIFIMPILSSYKTGYHLNGQVSPSVKGKMWKANGAKINILQQSCYLFYD